MHPTLRRKLCLLIRRLLTEKLKKNSFLYSLISKLKKNTYILKYNFFLFRYKFLRQIYLLLAVDWNSQTCPKLKKEKELIKMSMTLSRQLFRAFFLSTNQKSGWPLSRKIVLIMCILQGRDNHRAFLKSTSCDLFWHLSWVSEILFIWNNWDHVALQLLWCHNQWQCEHEDSSSALFHGRMLRRCWCWFHFL